MSQTALEIFYGRDMDSKLLRDGKDIKEFQSYHNEMKAEMQFDKKAKTQYLVLSECLCFLHINH